MKKFLSVVLSVIFFINIVNANEELKEKENMTIYGNNSDVINKLPLNINIDLSKKGTVSESSFKVPFNIWGSKVIFQISNYIPIDNLDRSFRKEAKNINKLITKGHHNGKLIHEKENQYFKLKITLTPLGWASDKIKVTTLDYGKKNWKRNENNYYKWLHEKNNWIKKEYKDNEKIDFIVSIPLYGGDSGEGGKIIMLANLQRLFNYHIKIESLNDVQLPLNVVMNFSIEMHSRKY